MYISSGGELWAFERCDTLHWHFRDHYTYGGDHNHTENKDWIVSDESIDGDLWQNIICDQ